MADSQADDVNASLPTTPALLLFRYGASTLSLSVHDQTQPSIRPAHHDQSPWGEQVTR